MNSEEKKLHDIGIADFVLTDLMLYLDTHPSDQKAMEYFNHYTDQNTDGAGICQRSLPTAQGSRRKQQGLALGQCPSPLGRRL